MPASKTPAAPPLDVDAERKALESVLERVDDLDEAALDELPVGLIKLDKTGKILAYNKTEAELARVDQRHQLGRNFFYDLAPCTRVQDFYGRFTAGVAKQQLNETFGFNFKFAHGARYVAITLLYARDSEAVWVIVSQARSA